MSNDQNVRADEPDEFQPDPLLLEDTAEPTNAAQRLRAFEDEHLREDVERVNGHIERGSGSRFSSLTPDERAHHAAIENLVKAEEKHSSATAAMSAADAELAAAVARVEATEDPAKAAKAERESR